MACDINAQDQLTQAWNRPDPKTIVAIQCGLMCDALNGVDVTTELNPIALQQRYNCFARLSMSQLMGIWTTLWAQFLKIINAGVAGTGQIVNYNVDPNAEGVTPANPLAGAFAYPFNGGGTIFQWKPPNGPWQ